MKRIALFIALAVLSIFGFQSCNDKVDLIGDFTETAVVYGLLDKADSIHFVKITRAFIGPGNSLEIAQIPDSSYFQAVNAVVKEYINGSLARTFTLKDTLVDNKDENGVFYAPQQKLYVFYTPFSDPLLSGSNIEYRLEADINNGEFMVTGETEIVAGVYSPNTDSDFYSFKFKKSNGDFPNPGVQIETGNSRIVNVKLLIDIEEFIGVTSSNRTLSWQLGETEVDPNENRSFAANGLTFFELVSSFCSNGDPLIDKRNLTGMTLKVVAGSDDLYQYIQANKPSSSVAQNKPSFTNLEASNDHEVVGIFSSRFTHTYYHPMEGAFQTQRCIDKTTTEELCIGAYTGPYFFCSQHSVDIANNEFWACN